MYTVTEWNYFTFRLNGYAICPNVWFMTNNGLVMINDNESTACGSAPSSCLFTVLQRRCDVIAWKRFHYHRPFVGGFFGYRRIPIDAEFRYLRLLLALASYEDKQWNCEWFHSPWRVCKVSVMKKRQLLYFSHCYHPWFTFDCDDGPPLLKWVNFNPRIDK